MLCASGVSVNPWHCQHLSELGLGSLWGLWDWSHGVDMATASLEPLQVLTVLWDHCLPAAQSPELLTLGRAINASPGYLQLQQLTWGSARFKCLQ